VAEPRTRDQAKAEAQALMDAKKPLATVLARHPNFDQRFGAFNEGGRWQRSAYNMPYSVTTDPDAAGGAPWYTVEAEKIGEPQTSLKDAKDAARVMSGGMRGEAVYRAGSWYVPIRLNSDLGDWSRLPREDGATIVQSLPMDRFVAEQAGIVDVTNPAGMRTLTRLGDRTLLSARRAEKDLHTVVPKVLLGGAAAAIGAVGLWWLITHPSHASSMVPSGAQTGTPLGFGPGPRYDASASAASLAP
jgi:hypothetical protein